MILAGTKGIHCRWSLAVHTQEWHLIMLFATAANDDDGGNADGQSDEGKRARSSVSLVSKSMCKHII